MHLPISVHVYVCVHARMLTCMYVRVCVLHGAIACV